MSATTAQLTQLVKTLEEERDEWKREVESADRTMIILVERNQSRARSWKACAKRWRAEADAEALAVIFAGKDYRRLSADYDDMRTQRDTWEEEHGKVWAEAEGLRRDRDEWRTEAKSNLPFIRKLGAERDQALARVAELKRDFDRVQGWHEQEYTEVLRLRSRVAELEVSLAQAPCLHPDVKQNEAGYWNCTNCGTNSWMP